MPAPVAIVRRLLLSAVAASIVGGAAPAVADEAPTRTRVAVVPFERLGPADPAYDTLQKHLVDAIGTFPQLEAIAQAPRCGPDDRNCLVEAARSVNASHVVHGSVERFTDGYALNVFLTVTRDGSSRKSGRVVRGGAPALRESAAAGVCDLLLKDRCVGTLRVDGPAGARVFVNRRDVGAVPLSGAIAMGRHVLHVARDGASTRERAVSVGFGEIVSLQVEPRGGALGFADDVSAGGDARTTQATTQATTQTTGKATVRDEKAEQDHASAEQETQATKTTTAEAPATTAQTEKSSTTKQAAAASVMTDVTKSTPATKSQTAFRQRPEGTSVLRPVFYGSLVASGVLGLTGIGFGIVAEVGAAELNQKHAANQLTPADAASYDAVRMQSSVANLCFGLAALGLVTAGVAYLIDPATIESGGSRRVSKGAVAVIPLLSPEVGGFSVGGQF